MVNNDNFNKILQGTKNVKEQEFTSINNTVDVQWYELKKNIREANLKSQLLSKVRMYSAFRESDIVIRIKTFLCKNFNCT